MSEDKCADCGQKADLKCSACKLVAYCGKDHQKKHWKEHKSACRPFEIVADAEIGKCLVATRDISPGDVILAELPLIHGPRPHLVEEGPVPCPGCCRLILAEQSPRCEGCDFPVCHPACEGLKDMERHGHECAVLGLRDVSAINGLHEFYRQDVLLPLRCLLLQKRHPKKWLQLLDMEAHMERRAPGTEIYREVDEKVVDYLNSNFFDPMRILEGRSGQQVLAQRDRETIHKVCGIIDVNALEINLDGEVTSLYPTAYLMEHSCMPNTTHIFDNQKNGYKITVKAALSIKKGEHISTMYTHALWGTQARREHLRETKYFSCKCPRCADPSELGSYLSALRCMGNGEEACGGVQLPIDPLDDKTEWACDKCEVKLANQEVCFLINQIGEEVDNIQLSNPTVRELDSLLTKLLNFLHPNHYHVYSVKHSLIQLFGYQQGYTPTQITDDCLARKSELCRNLLEITRKIDPGNARLPLYTGVILHELHLANMIAVKRKWDVGMKTRVKSIVSMLRECKSCLKEARKVLKNEVGAPAGEKLNNLITTSIKEFIKFLERNKIDLDQEIDK